MLQKNPQKPTKPLYRPSGTLQVHSIFPTIQGEGPYAGHRAVFIRLAHCNLQCPGCDTEYTEGAEDLDPIQIMGRVLKVGDAYELVVITGGEPFRQDIRPLVDKLINDYGYKVQIETNGVLFPFDLPGATIVVSPKTSIVHKDLQHRANAYKYVLEAYDVDLDDGLPIHALRHKVNVRVARPPDGYLGPVYVQPMDSANPEVNQRNLSACLDAVEEHGYILCLQLHKIIGKE